MKRSRNISMVSLLICSIIFLYFFYSNRNNGDWNRIDPTAIKKVGNVDISYQTKKKTNLKDIQRVIGDKYIIRTEYFYQDKDMNTYIFNDQGKLTAMQRYHKPSEDNPTPAGVSRITKEQAIGVVQSEVKPIVEDFDTFELDSVTESEADYQVLYLRHKGSINEDRLGITVGQDGSLQWFVIFYTNLDSVSKEDIQFFESEVRSYFEKEYGITDYTTKVSYQMLDDTLAAYYTITYKDPSGGDASVMIAIGKEK